MLVTYLPHYTQYLRDSSKITKSRNFHQSFQVFMQIQSDWFDNYIVACPVNFDRYFYVNKPRPVNKDHRE